MEQGQASGRRRGFVYAPAPRPPEHDWIAVVAESFVALIESGPGDRGVDALAQLVGEEETSLERVVSAIPVGDGGVDSFAVVHVDAAEEDGWQVTCIARGRAVVDVYSIGGARRFASSGVQPWLIATFRDVVAMDLGAPARRFDAVSRRAAGASPVGLGTTPAGSILWSAGAVAESDDARGIVAAFARPAADLDDDTIRSNRGRDKRETGGSGRGLLQPPPGFADETIRHARPLLERAALSLESGARNERQERAALRAEPSAPLLDVPGTRPVLDSGTEDGAPDGGETAGNTDDSDPAEGQGRASGGPTGGASGGASGGSTGGATGRASGGSTGGATGGPTGGPYGGPAGAATDANVPDRVFVGIRGSEPIELDRPVVFGRRPVAPGRSCVHPLLVSVPSPAREVSASHVRIERCGSVVVVTDLKSRNGTTVSIQGGRARRLRPGESLAVPGAALVEIGDGTSIEITPYGGFRESPAP